MRLWKRLLARSPSFSAIFGDVVFRTDHEVGIHTTHSFFQWRVKRALDNKVYISAKIIADFYEGPEGSLRNYINFDIQAAERLKDGLEECIRLARIEEDMAQAILRAKP